MQSRKANLAKLAPQAASKTSPIKNSSSPIKNASSIMQVN